MNIPGTGPEQQLVGIRERLALGQIHAALHESEQVRASSPAFSEMPFGPRLDILRARAFLDLERYAQAREEFRTADAAVDPHQDIVGWLEVQGYDVRAQRLGSPETVFAIVDAEHALGFASHHGAKDTPEGRRALAALAVEKATLLAQARCHELAAEEIAAVAELLGEQDGRLWLARAQLHLVQDQRLEARDACQRALACGGSTVRHAQLALCHVHYLLGELRAAEAALRPLFPFAPGDLGVRRRYLMLLMAQERWDDSITVLQDRIAQVTSLSTDICEDNTAAADDLYALACLYERAGKYDDAIRTFDSIAGDEDLGADAQRMAERMRRPDARLKPRKRLPAFPTVAQLRNHCGPASCELYMRFFGLPADQVEIARQIKEPEGGTPVHRMRRFLMEAGFMTRRVEADLPVLKRLINGNVPVIMEEEYSESLHVAVAIGYDDIREVLEVQDPMTHRIRETPYEDLPKIRNLSNHGALIAVPRGDPKWMQVLDAAQVPECRYIALVDDAFAALDAGAEQEADAMVDESQQIEKAYEMAWIYRWSRAHKAWREDRDDQGKLAALRTIAEGAAALWPDDEWPQQYLGRVNLWSDKLDEAQEAFATAIDRDPGDSRNWAMMASCLQARGDTREAFEAYRKALQRDPAYESVLVETAWITRELGGGTAPWMLSQMACERAEEDASAWMLRGLLLAERERFEEAVAAFETATEHEPTHVGARAEKAKAWFDGLDRQEDGIALMRQVYEEDRELDQVAVELMRMLHSRGAYDDLVAVASEQLGREEPPPAAFAFLGSVLRERGPVDQARAALAQAIHEHPGYGFAYAELAKLAAATGQHDEAFEAWACAVGATGGMPTARVQLARALMRNNQFEAAKEQLGRVIDNSGAEDSLAEACALYMQRGEDAGSRLAAAFEDYGDKLTPRVAMARAMHLVGAFYGKMDALCGPIAELAPEHPLALAHQGFRTMHLAPDRARVSEGEALLRRAMAAAPRYEIPRVLLAWALCDDGRPAEALAVIEPCALRSPAVDWRCEALYRLGRFDEVEPLVARFLHEADNPNVGANTAALIRFKLARARGDDEGALALARQIAPTWGESEADQRVTFWERTIFELMCRLRQDAAAQEYGQRIAPPGEQAATLARYAVEADHPGLAQFFLQRAGGPGTGDPEALWAAARLAELGGDLNTACQHVGHGAQAEPDSFLWSRESARLMHLGAGNLPAARAALEDALAKNGADMESLALRGQVALLEGQGPVGRQDLEIAWRASAPQDQRRRGHWQALLSALSGQHAQAQAELGQYLQVTPVSAFERSRLEGTLQRAAALAPVPSAEGAPNLDVPGDPKEARKGTGPVTLPPQVVGRLAPIEDSPWKPAEPEPELTAAKRFGLACGAILVAIRDESFVHLGGLARNAYSGLFGQNTLAHSWSVSCREEALDVTSWLLEAGHNKRFQTIRQWLATQAPGQLDLDSLELPSADLYEIEMVRQHGAGEAGIIAWDLGRLVNVAGWAYHAGYLTADEAWSRIEQAAKRLQQTHSSWADFCDKYQLGRSFWKAEDTEGALLQSSPKVQNLLRDPTSPWMTIPWGTPLEPW